MLIFRGIPYTVIQSSAQRCEESPENREVAMRSAGDASAAARPLHDSILGRFRVHMWDDALALTSAPAAVERRGRLC